MNGNTYPIGYRQNCFLAMVNGNLMQFASDTDYYDIRIAYLLANWKREKMLLTWLICMRYNDLVTRQLR